MSVRLPMFPLGTVLVPHAVLPLHVFEPRYRMLTYDCLLGDKEFGVVLIERGSEVGGHDQRFGLATVARIATATELPDGRWFVLAVGTRRVQVAEWLSDDPYPQALVDERPEPPWPAGDVAAAAVGDALVAAERVVRGTLALAVELGDEVTSATFELSPEPSVAAWELLAAAPLGSLDKQRLLGVDDHEERLRMLAALAEEQSLLLAYRFERE